MNNFLFCQITAKAPEGFDARMAAMKSDPPEPVHMLAKPKGGPDHHHLHHHHHHHHIYICICLCKEKINQKINKEIKKYIYIYIYISTYIYIYICVSV